MLLFPGYAYLLPRRLNFAHVLWKLTVRTHMTVGLPAFIVTISVRNLAFNNVVVLALLSFR